MTKDNCSFDDWKILFCKVYESEFGTGPTMNISFLPGYYEDGWTPENTFNQVFK